MRGFCRFRSPASFRKPGFCFDPHDLSGPEAARSRVHPQARYRPLAAFDRTGMPRAPSVRRDRVVVRRCRIRSSHQDEFRSETSGRRRQAMSGWRNHAVPLLILPALLAGCQTPRGGRIALDLPMLRTTRVDAAGPWFAWWGERGGSGSDELTGRAQFASLPDVGDDEIRTSLPVERGDASAEPRRLPEPVSEPIPIEKAAPGLPTEFLRRPAGSDWTLRP